MHFISLPISCLLLLYLVSEIMYRQSTPADVHSKSLSFPAIYSGHHMCTLCAGASHTPDKERVKGQVYSNIKVAVELLNGCLMSSSTYPRPSPWGGERAL